MCSLQECPYRMLPVRSFYYHISSENITCFIHAVESHSSHVKGTKSPQERHLVNLFQSRIYQVKLTKKLFFHKTLINSLESQCCTVLSWFLKMKAWALRFLEGKQKVERGSRKWPTSGRRIWAVIFLPTLFEFTFKGYNNLLNRHFLSLNTVIWSSAGLLSDLRQLWMQIGEEKQRISLAFPVCAVEISSNSLALFDILEWFLNVQKGQILNPDLVRNAVASLRRTAPERTHRCEKEIFLKQKWEERERERELARICYCWWLCRPGNHSGL